MASYVAITICVGRDGRDVHDHDQGLSDNSHHGNGATVFMIKGKVKIPVMKSSIILYMQGIASDPTGSCRVSGWRYIRVFTFCEHKYMQSLTALSEGAVGQ